MEPSQIAEQLVKSGKITAAEKETYFTYGTEYSLDTPEDKATHDKVEKLVTEYNESKTPPELTGNDKIDTVEYPDKEPLGPSTTGLPAVNVTSGDKGSSVSVSTAALTKFSENLAELEKLVLAQYNEVNKVAIKPGTFGAGVFLTEKIQKGLRNDTLHFLQSVRTTFGYIRADIQTLITNYDTTEERSSMTGEELNNMFYDAWGKVNNFDNFGNTTTENIGLAMLDVTRTHPAQKIHYSTDFNAR